MQFHATKFLAGGFVHFMIVSNAPSDIKIWTTPEMLKITHLFVPISFPKFLKPPSTNKVNYKQIVGKMS